MPAYTLTFLVPIGSDVTLPALYVALKLSYSPTYEGQRARGAGLQRKAVVCAVERLDAVRTVPGRLVELI